MLICFQEAGLLRPLRSSAFRYVALLCTAGASRSYARQTLTPKFPVAGFKQPPLLQCNVQGDHALLIRVMENLFGLVTDIYELLDVV